MLRIICVQYDVGDVVYGGAAKAPARYRTFDVHMPDVEAWLMKAPDASPRTVIGVEMAPENTSPKGGAR